MRFLCSFPAKREQVVGLITIVDLMEYITESEKTGNAPTLESTTEISEKKLSKASGDSVELAASNGSTIA